MIKILNIISDTNIGGAGRVLLNYLHCSDRSCFETEVALPRGSALLGPIRALDIPAYEVDGMADRSLAPGVIPALCRVVGRSHPDLIHAHGSLAGRAAARLKGRKVVYTKHCAFPPGALLSSPPGRLANRLLDACLSDGVIAIGASAEEVLVQSGIPRRKIHVLLNGVPPLPVPTPEQRTAARALLGIQPEDFVLGILARIEPYKGHDILLRAAAELLARGRRVKVLVAGAGSGEEALRRQAESLPPEAVVFTGFVARVEEALWAMDVQVNASTQSETSSLSLLEGMSIGLPALASNMGGNPLLIRDGVNGLLFPNGDSHALAEAAAGLMDDPGRMARLSQGAKTVYQARFTGEIMAKNIEDIYRDVLKGAK